MENTDFELNRNSLLSSLNVLEDPAAEESKRQEAIKALVEAGCVYELKGDWMQVQDNDLKKTDAIKNKLQTPVTDAANVGLHFCVKLPEEEKTAKGKNPAEEKNPAVMYLKNTKGAYTKVTMNNSFISQAFNNQYLTFLKSATDPFFDAKTDPHTANQQKKDVKMLWANYCLYDENDLLIDPNDVETRNNTKNIQFHLPVNADLNRSKVMENRMPLYNKIVAEGDQKARSKEETKKVKTENYQKDLDQKIDGLKNNIKDSASVREFVQDFFENKNLDADLKSVYQKALADVLNVLKAGGYVTDAEGVPFADKDTIGNGTRCMIRVDGESKFNEGKDVTAIGLAKDKNGKIEVKQTDLGTNRESYFTFLKTGKKLHEPKQPNGFWRALDRVNRFFGGRGLDRCNKYNNDMAIYERSLRSVYQTANSLPISPYAESSALLTVPEKTENCRNWERNMVMNAYQALKEDQNLPENDKFLENLADNELFDRFCEQKAVKEYLNICQNTLKEDFHASLENALNSDTLAELKTKMTAFRPEGETTADRKSIAHENRTKYIGEEEHKTYSVVKKGENKAKVTEKDGEQKEFSGMQNSGF